MTTVKATNSCIKNVWIVLFVQGHDFVGIKTKTNGVDHPPRWEYSRPMSADETLAFCIKALASHRTAED